MDDTENDYFLISKYLLKDAFIDFKEIYCVLKLLKLSEFISDCLDQFLHKKRKVKYLFWKLKFNASLTEIADWPTRMLLGTGCLVTFVLFKEMSSRKWSLFEVCKHVNHRKHSGIILQNLENIKINNELFVYYYTKLKMIGVTLRYVQWFYGVYYGHVSMGPAGSLTVVPILHSSVPDFLCVHFIKFFVMCIWKSFFPNFGQTAGIPYTPCQTSQ